MQGGTEKWYGYCMVTRKKLILEAVSPFDANCPSRRALDLIADKWTPLVIYLLIDGPQRYTQLKRQIGGISQKMLTQTLRKLEEESLVTRTVYPTAPPSVEYALTPLGETLLDPLIGLLEWAQTFGLQIRSPSAGKPEG